MLFFSVVAAFVADFFLPAPGRRGLGAAARRLTSFVRASLDAGERHNAVIAWTFLVAPLCLAVGLIAGFARELNTVFGWLVNVVILYLALDFQFAIRALDKLYESVRKGEPLEVPPLARYRDWIPADANELARLGIEAALLHAHRFGFAPIFWFAVLGPAGATLYWAAFALMEHWDEDRRAAPGSFGAFARRAYLLIDWMPARLTAVTVAIVGNFEDAVFCWRSQAAAWLSAEEGVVLAGGAGAIGVRLGQAYHTTSGIEPRPELGTDQAADADSMRSAQGLLWRALVVWVGALFLLSAAGWVAV